MDTPNLVEHFTTNTGALELATIFDVELKSFKTGEIILSGLSALQLSRLIGIGDDGDSVNTGLRFHDEIAQIESTPNFAAKNPLIDDGDPSDTVRGVIKISAPAGDYNLDIIIQKFNLASSTTKYSFTLVPDVTIDKLFFQKYLSVLVALLSKEEIR